MAIFDVSEREPVAGEWGEMEAPDFPRAQLIRQLEAAHEWACGVMRAHGHRHPDTLGGKVFAQKCKRDGKIVNAVTSARAKEAELVLIGIRNVMDSMKGDDKAAIADAALFLGMALANPMFAQFQGRRKQGKRAAHSIEFDNAMTDCLSELHHEGAEITHVTLFWRARERGVKGATEAKVRSFLTRARKAHS